MTELAFDEGVQVDDAREYLDVMTSGGPPHGYVVSDDPPTWRRHWRLLLADPHCTCGAANDFKHLEHERQNDVTVVFCTNCYRGEWFRWT